MSFAMLVIPSLTAASAGVRQQCNFAGVLDCLGDFALFLHRDASDATGADLSAVGDELAQQCYVLVVDDCDVSGLQGVGLWFGLTEFSLSHRGAPFLWSPWNGSTGWWCSTAVATRVPRGTSGGSGVELL